MQDRSLTPARLEAVERFVTAASAYCACLEGGKVFPLPDFVRRVSGLVPELYRAALDLPDVAPTSRSDDLALRLAAKEAARLTRSMLPAALVEHGIYWHMFDPLETPPDQPVASALGEDLMEIYEDVRTGLPHWQTATLSEKADLAWSWREAFIFHWGRHATAALPALHVFLHERLPAIDPP